MLGIWHAGEWMKKELAQPFYGRVEHGSPIRIGFAFINKKFFTWYLMCKYIGLYVDSMDDVSFIFMLLLCLL